jgi:sec-independent protein translocase protein TatA
MGLGGISMGSLVLIFFIILLLFGTKKIRNMGEDLGHALKSFRKGLRESDNSGDRSKPNDLDKTKLL